jgi:hypothetical protein
MKKIASCLVFFVGASNVWALDLGFDVSVGVDHTDNSLKVSENKVSDIEYYGQAELEIDHDGQAFSADIDYSAETISFERNTQDDGTIVTGDAVLVYKQIPQRLSWTVENSRRSVVRDRELTDILSNREERSISKISPAMILRVSPLDSIRTVLSYTNIDYEESVEQESERTGAQIGWLRNLSKVDTMYLNVNYEDVELDVYSYDYYLATLGYQVVLSRFNYEFVVGYNESQRDKGNASDSYFSLAAEYDDGSGSIFSLRGVQELTDTSRRDNNDSVDGFSDFNGGNSVEVDLFTRTNVELEYVNSKLCGLCTFHTLLIYEEEDYKDLNNDVEEYVARVTLSYELTRLWSLRGSATYRDASFKNDNLIENYDISIAALNLYQQISRQFELVYEIAHEERVSQDSDAQYKELRGGIRFNYSF